MKRTSDGGTPAIPDSGAAGAGDSAAGGSGAMPADLDALESRFADAGGNAGAGAGPDAGPAQEPVGKELLAGLVGLPYDLGVLKTGHDFWTLNASERDLLTGSGERWLEQRGLSIDMATSPGTIHLMAHGVFIAVRVLRELVLIRLALQSKADAK